MHSCNLNQWLLFCTQDIPVLSHNLVPMKWRKWGLCISSQTRAHSFLFNKWRDRTERERQKMSGRLIHFSTLCVLDLVCLTLQWGWCARAFRRGGAPESRQGHCLLLYITLPPSGNLREEESRRLAAVAHEAMCEYLENTLFLVQRTARTSQNKDIKGITLRMQD